MDTSYSRHRCGRQYYRAHAGFTGQAWAAGYANVRTYIQSGNVIVDTPKTDAAIICKHLAACIQDGFGFTPKIMALPLVTFAKIITDNPLPDAVDPPKNLHISFLSEPARNVEREHA